MVFGLIGTRKTFSMTVWASMGSEQDVYGIFCGLNLEMR